MDDRVILAVSDDFLPAATGVGMHMQTVYRELAKKGFKIVVMTSRQKDQSSYEKWNGVDVYRYKSICIAGFYQALPTAPQIKKLIRDNNIGLVHFHYLSTMTLQVNKLCKRLRIPKIYTYHMTEDHLTQPLFMRPFRGLIRAGIVRLCNSMDLVIFPSQKLMDSASNRGVKKPCLYLTNPLVPDLFNPPLHVNGITDTAAFNILFAGRLNAEKNVPLLLKAFALHMTAFPDSRLWIAGEGTSKSALKKLCDELGIAAHVNFLGFLSHEVLATYYQACQVFVLPSFVETQGIVAMEAMRFKKPVIVTREIVSAAELVDHEMNGYIVDAYDESDLAARLDALAASPDLQRGMGEKSFNKSNAYNPEIVADKLAEIYTQEMARA